MRSHYAAFLVATATSAVLTPVVLRVARRLGAVSQPGGRHVHRAAIPRLGGIAISLAFLLPIAGLFMTNTDVATIMRHDAWKTGGLLIGGTAMVGVGIVDDTRGLRASHKLLAQLLVATFAFICGFRIETISLPVVGGLSMGIFAWPVTVLWVVGIMNAVNLIDGLDGLAAGIVLFAGITNLVIAVMAGSVFIAVVMSAMIGAVLGFLLFNFNPARIFMGDSGSYFLGYALATSVLVGTSQKTSTTVALLVPCVALGVPIFDTLFSMVRRFLERRPIFSPDRGHIHHRLLDMGLTHRRAVLTIYSVSALLSVAAIATSLGRAWQAGVAILASSVALFALVRFAGYFNYLQRHLQRRGRLRNPQVEILRRALPEIPEQLAESATEDVLFARLDRVAAALRIDRLQVRSVNTSTVAHEWRAQSSSTRDEADVVEATLPLGSDGAARSELVVGWARGDGALTPDLEVLLRVFADMIERALFRLGSSHAAPVQSRPVGYLTLAVPSNGSATSSKERLA